MKKYVLIFAVALVALAVAMPAVADVEFSVWRSVPLANQLVRR